MQGFARALPESPVPEVLAIVASRAARSARLVPHHALDSAREPVRGPYQCHKHHRVCRPVERADHFLRRYAADTQRRLAAFAGLRTAADVSVLHADARSADLPDRLDGVVTSPPYPGLIDYHEQHRTAYELLGLQDRRELELGAGRLGTSQKALAAYAEGMVEALAHTRRHLRRDASVVVVVNDRHGLYDAIAERAGYTLRERSRRHVNRRTGRRAGEYFEEVLVLRPRRSSGRPERGRGVLAEQLERRASAGVMRCGERSTIAPVPGTGTATVQLSSERQTWAVVALSFAIGHRSLPAPCTPTALSALTTNRAASPPPITPGSSRRTISAASLGVRDR